MIKNKEIFYKELRRNVIAVQKSMSEDAGLVFQFVKLVETLTWLSEQTMKEGVLWLECIAEGCRDFEPDVKRISKMMLTNELTES